MLEWYTKQNAPILANAVIASGMGYRAQALFNENRIEVVVGAPGDEPEKVVVDYIRGELSTGDNICDH